VRPRSSDPVHTLAAIGQQQADPAFGGECDSGRLIRLNAIS
jgi:hypothetical protein